MFLRREIGQQANGRKRRIFAWGVIAVVLAAGVVLETCAFGQQVAVQTPFVSVREGYFETIGTSWAIRGPNWFAQFGGAPVTAGFGPQGALGGGQVGIGWSKGNVSGHLWMYAHQGCVRSMTTTAPAVVLTPGWPGWVADVSVTPFVMGYIPVVGWAPVVAYPQGWSPPWWYTPYWWGPGFPYFPHLPPRGAPRPNPREKDPPSPPPRKDYRRSYPEHRRDAYPRNPAAVQDQADRSGNRLAAELDRSDVFDEAAVMRAGVAGSGGGGGSGELVPTRDDAASGRGATGGWAIERSSAEIAVPSVAELAARRARELEAQEAEARQLLEKAQAAQEEGKLGVAKVYYRMAASRSTGTVRQLALEGLASLDQAQGKTAEAVVAVSQSAGNRPVPR